MKISYKILLVIATLVLMYAVGPRANYEKGSPTPIKNLPSIEEVEAYVHRKESRYDDIRSGNEAQIIWGSKKNEKTRYSIVYIHGFSASGVEGKPIHEEIARRYGFNIYIPRLRLHGREGVDVMKDLTPDMLIDDAEEALQIGGVLGDSIIVMSCSTGSTLSIINGPRHSNIAAYIMYSPNIDLYDPTSELITMPWGEEIMTMVMQGKYNNLEYTEEQQKYWYSKYHIRSIIALKSMIQNWMKEEQFRKIDKPLYMGYYYKDDEHQDDIVSVPRMLEFVDQVRTPRDLIRTTAFPDVGYHVICSDLFTKDYVKVLEDTDRFMSEVLHLKHAEHIHVPLIDDAVDSDL